MSDTKQAVDMNALNEKIQQESAFIDLLTLEINKVIVGQKEMVERLLIGLIGQGHILLEGVPGLAKTLAINTLSQAVKGEFSRIQFTPDLMPSDIIGSEILDENRKFRFVKGPLFSNIILADEINRTPPKTQSALLEAMQERACVVAAGNLHSLILTCSGAVYACGHNDGGVLGHGIADQGNAWLPTLIEGLDEKICAVTSGAAHAIANTSDGRAWGWGYGNDASLGLQLTDHQVRPLEYPELRIATPAV